MLLKGLCCMQGDRPTRAVVLKDKSVVMLYNVDGDVYCSDANSTAFKFPLTHAKIVKGKQHDLCLWQFFLAMLRRLGNHVYSVQKLQVRQAQLLKFLLMEQFMI